MGCTSGFLSIVDLQRAATSGNDARNCRSVCWTLTNRNQNQQRIIPDMMFNCRGNISKWIVGSYEQRSQDYSAYLELQIWRLHDGSSSVYTRQQRSRFRDSSCENGVTSVSTNVYSCTLPLPGLAVQPGDILGIYQPRRRNSRYIMYVDRRTGGTSLQTYISRSSTSLSDISQATADSVQPLVAVEIGKPYNELYLGHTIM